MYQFRSSSACISVMAFVFMCANAVASVRGYPNPRIYPLSTTYTLSVNGTDVPVTAYQVGDETSPEYHYAHFSFDGNAKLKVTANTNISTATVSPLAFAIPTAISGDTVTFTISTSRYLIVKINGLPELVILADPLETDVPAAQGHGIYNIVQGYRADPSGESYSTTAIQNAIDAATVAGGGTVYVPDGIYKIGNLTLKSNVTLYLAGGAVLRGSGVSSDYAVNFRKETQKMDGTWFISTAANSSNITIRGRGTIDANGISMRNAGLLSHLIFPLETSHFVIDGVIGRDAGLWALVATRSSNVMIRNYKGLQSLKYIEDDAIDIQESQNVQVVHTIGISNDDAYSTKTWAVYAGDITKNWPGPAQPLRHVMFDDAFAWTEWRAFKVGFGSKQPQTDIIFRNGYVYNAKDVGVAVIPKDGPGLVQSVLYENIDVENVGQAWLSLQSVGSDVQNITLRNINVRHIGRSVSSISSNPNRHLRNVWSEHVLVNGVPAIDTANLHATVSNSSGVVTMPYISSDQIQAEEYTSASGIQLHPTTDSGGGENVGSAKNGAYVAYAGLDFGASTSSVNLRIATANSGGSIELHLGSVTGKKIGSYSFPASTGGWQKWQTVNVPITPTSGMQALYAVFTTPNSGYVANLNWLQLQRSVVQAKSYLDKKNVSLESSTDSGGGRDVTDIADGSYVGYKRTDFGSAVTTLFLRLAATSYGTFEVHLDSPTGTIIGTLPVQSTGLTKTWSTIPLPVSGLTGVHALYIVATGNDEKAPFASLNWISY